MKLSHFLTISGFVIAAILADDHESQPSVTSDTKEHALYLWIHVNPSANASEVAKVMANLQDLVDHVSPSHNATEQTKILAGVGFGEEFYRKVGRHPRNFTYIQRSGVHGILPATGGDVFVHAKSDSYSKLFELAQEVLRWLPKHSVDSFEDIYGFVYKDGRDLTGFIDGTENPKALWHRKGAAVEVGTGGSFVLTQRWIHDMELIEETEVRQLERIIGRTKADSVKLSPLPSTSHISRMVGATEPHKRFEVVRQSQPYGNLYSECGLFFIAYSNSTENLDFMLDNMVGKGESNVNDDVMLVTKPVSGNYWYFPGAEELKELAL